MGRTSKGLIKFLSEAEVIAINEEVVSCFGGVHGVRDLNSISLAVGRPAMSVNLTDAYESIFDKAAAMLHSLLNNHPFLDGNKRTASFSAVLFLELNNWKIEVEQKDLVKFTREVHDMRLSVKEIAEWLKKNSKEINK